MKRQILLFVVLFSLGANVYAQPRLRANPMPGTEKVAEDRPASYYKIELYFGLSDNGKRITERKWKRFVDEYITPAFPDGLTILEADGQWRNKENKITKEESMVVVLICRPDAATVQKIEAIKHKYKELYHQESVLEVDTKAENVAF